MKEGDIRKALKARVEAYGGQVRPQSWLGTRGAPDVRVLFPTDSPGARQFRAPHEPPYGRNFDIETKRPKGGRVSKAQHDAMELISRSGGEALLITTHAELDAWLPPR